MRSDCGGLSGEIAGLEAVLVDAAAIARMRRRPIRVYVTRNDDDRDDDDTEAISFFPLPSLNHMTLESKATVPLELSNTPLSAQQFARGIWRLKTASSPQQKTNLILSAGASPNNLKAECPQQPIGGF